MAPLRIRHGAIPFEFCPLTLVGGRRNRGASDSTGQLTARYDAPCYKTLNNQDLIRLRNPVNPSQRGSVGPSSQEQGWVLRLAPQCGQSPLQSGLHSVLTGRDKSTCSRSTSSSRQTVSLIITDFGLRRCYGPFGGIGIDSNGAEDEVKVGGQGNFDRLDASGAGNLEIAGEAALQANVGDDFLRPAVLVNHFGTGRKWPECQFARLLRRNRSHRA